MKDRIMSTMQAKKNHSGAVYFWAGFLLPTLIAGIGFFLIGVWPSGDGTVLIIDSLHQYLPFYTDFHEKLRSGQGLLYSFSAGLGYNFWATYAYYLASPLNFLIVLVPKANVCDFMDLMILVKIGLCGGTFSWYMHQRNTRSFALPAVFGTMFALSSFVIGYYFNLMWLDSVAMLPLISRGIEQICGIGRDRRLTQNSDGRLYGLALCCGIWCNYYIGFMLCIYSVLYFLVCSIIAGTCRLALFARRVLRFGWYSLLGGGIGAVVLLPAYRALTISESMQNNSFPKTLDFYDSFMDMMLTHFAGIKPINIASTQVGLNAYCGVAVLILVLLFVLDRSIALRERIARLALAGFLLLSFSLRPLNYMWHGFHQQNGLPNRFAFIYIAVVLTMSFDSLKNLKKTSVWKVAAAGVIPVAAALILFIGNYGRDFEDKEYPAYVYLITVALLCGYGLILFLVRMTRISRRSASVLLAVVCTLEAGISGVFGIICNDSVTRSIYLNDQKSYRELMSQFSDEGWYRSEVDAQRMRNVTLFCGGNSVVMFNSTMQQSVTRFCDAIGMEARTNKNGYNGVTKLMNDVLGIRYVLSANGTGSSLYGFKEVASDDNLTVYKNEDALPLGFLVNDTITQWDTTQGTPIEVQDSFVTLATGHEPIYTLDRYVDLESGADNGILIPEGKQVYVYLPSRVKELRLRTPEYSKTYSTYTDHLYVINACDGSYEAGMTATLSSDTAQKAIIYTCPDALEKEVRDELARVPLENVTARGSRLTGTIRADRDAELLITIPYDRNWTCRVDGKVTEADCIGGALTGIALTEGEHTITLTYMPDGMKTGALISLLCAALMILSLILADRRRKRNIALGKDKTIDETMINTILDIAGEDHVLEMEPMKKHTTFRIGGPADLFVIPDSEKKLTEVVDYCRRSGVEFYIVGNGSNLLVSDDGYRGVIIQIGRNLSEVTVVGEQIFAQAGALLSTISHRALDASLTGMESLSGIPGTLGGALTMNAGAYGAEMKDITSQVTVLTQEGRIITLTAKDLKFGYRTSIIQKENMIVLSAVLKLRQGDREEILQTMQELRSRRQEKQPLDLPSAGSTFKRPEGHFAGALIDEAGLRGYRVGAAQISEKHCGFVVNKGDATAAQVRELISHVKQIVYDDSGVLLEPEVKMLGFDEDV